MPLPDGTENVLSKRLRSELRTLEIKYFIGCGTESLQKVEYMMMFWTFSLTRPLGVLSVVFLWIILSKIWTHRLWSEHSLGFYLFVFSHTSESEKWKLPTQQVFLEAGWLCRVQLVFSLTIQIYLCFKSSHHKRNKCQFVTAVWFRPLQYSALTAHDN